MNFYLTILLFDFNMEVDTKHKNVDHFFLDLLGQVKKGKKKVYDTRLKVKVYQENDSNK